MMIITMRMLMMMRPASVATLEMGKGTTRSQMSSLVSLHYTCALKCVIPHSVTLRCVTSLFLLCLCQCLDVQDLVTHWVSPWCPQQFQRCIWLDPEFRKPFFLARKERLTFRQWMCVGGKKNLLDLRWVSSPGVPLSCHGILQGAPLTNVITGWVN